MKTTLKLLPLMLLVCSHGVLAQQPPGGGIQLRQLPQPPPPQTATPEILIQEATTTVAPATDAVRILVNEIQVSGAQAFTAAELIAATGFTPGTESTLADLEAMASRITDYYRSRGYFVARAYLPAQDVSDGVVTIAVSEGNYGEVILRNNSTLADGVAMRALSGVERGEAITIAPLESRLLLLSDLPGVQVSSTLVPGSLPGSSDLIVEIDPGRRISGSIDADNAGNPYTGKYRLGATVNLNNPLGRGDVASLRLLTSGSGLRYGRAAYQMPFGRATAGVSYSRLDYELGKQFSDLGAHGTAEVASVFGTYTLVRSRDTNLYAGLTYDHRTFRDRIDLIDSVVDKRARVWTPMLYGNHRDDIGGGGLSTFFVSLSSGTLDIRTPEALEADAASARTNGSYQKLWANVTRLQSVSERVSLYASVTGQLASKNLDESEKMVLGGMDGVRAYPQGEGIGDQGVLVSLEARYLLSGLSRSLPGEVHLLGFADAGRITINKNPWNGGDNRRTLSGAGIGAMWVDPGNFAVRTYYASKLGGEEALSVPDKSGQFWIQVIKYF